MKRRILLVGVIFLSAFMVTGRAFGYAGIWEELEPLYVKAFAAFEKKNPEVFVKLCARDAVVKYPGGRKMTIKEWSAAVAKNLGPAENLQAGFQLNAVTERDGKAVVVTTQTIEETRFSPRDKKKHRIRTVETVFDTWVKTADGWRLQEMDNTAQDTTVDGKPVRSGGPRTIRVGLIDFDTSHVVEFTKRLNHIDIDQAEWVDGALVVAAFPGDSQIMPERIAGYTEEPKKYGIEIVSKPEDLIGKVDAVMIESQQGSRHLERARPFLERGIPTYVDKPFANSVKDADAMIALAKKHNAPLMSCSSLRYDPVVVDAIAKQAQLGKILSAEVYTSASLHPGNPGMFHYGIHGVEMLYALMGPGCKSVQMTFTPQSEVATGIWPNGQVGAVRGIREGAGGFGLTVHYEKGHFAAEVKGAAFYREMLKQIVKMFAGGAPPIDYSESREIVSFIVAAEKSGKADGTRVPLSR